MQYPAAYGANSSFGDTVSSQPTVRKTTRARVPPPSKIPSSAVEMPGDTLNNIGYLDVQFGGLDFGTEDSFDTLTDKFNATSLDSTSSVANPGDVASDYQSKNSQQSLTAGLQTSQMVSETLLFIFIFNFLGWVCLFSCEKFLFASRRFHSIG